MTLLSLRKIAGWAAVLGLGFALYSAPARADDQCPCDGVCYTCDGCTGSGSAQVKCCDQLAAQANASCPFDPGGWCVGTVCVAD